MMADHRAECASPRPMAFTVDFGPPEKSEHPKLGLRDNIGRFAPRFKSRVPAAASSKADEKEVILVDEENNIAELARGQQEQGGEEVSDAGTYTIDEDEEPVEAVKHVEKREEDIERTFGVPKAESDSTSRTDWVSAWAASNTFASDNPIQEEVLDDIDLDPEEERSSSSQRRRLPPTPQHRQQNGYHQTKVCPISFFLS